MNKQQYMETYEQLVEIADQMHHSISVCDRLIDQMLEDIYLSGGATKQLRTLFHEAVHMHAYLLKNYQYVRLIKTMLAGHIDNQSSKMEGTDPYETR